MPLWGNVDNANGQPKYVQALTRTGPQGSGKANKAANNAALFNNVTPLSFGGNNVVGSFAVTTQEFANTSSPEWAYPAHVGWQMRIEGTGGVASATGIGGSGFANGETVTVSGAGGNGTLVVSANATGNLAGFSVSTPGYGWPNNTSVTTTFNREMHLASVTVSVGGTGYSNTDVITASNGSINATATPTTNATGGITSVAVSNTKGIWPAGSANSVVAFSFKAANGAASAGSGATLTAGLGTSTGGTPTVVLGGRAGRIQYETVVAMGSITSTGNTIPF